MSNKLQLIYVWYILGDTIECVEALPGMKNSLYDCIIAHDKAHKLITDWSIK